MAETLAANNAGGVAGEQLRSVVERVEQLEEEKKALQEDIKEIYAEAKANGLQPQIIRQIIKIRKMEQSERQEQESLLELYMHALGM